MIFVSFICPDKFTLNVDFADICDPVFCPIANMCKYNIQRPLQNDQLLRFDFL